MLKGVLKPRLEGLRLALPGAVPIWFTVRAKGNLLTSFRHLLNILLFEMENADGSIVTALKMSY